MLVKAVQLAKQLVAKVMPYEAAKYYKAPLFAKAFETVVENPTVTDFNPLVSTKHPEAWKKLHFGRYNVSNTGHCSKARD